MKKHFKKLYRISYELPTVYCYICHKPITKQKDLTADHEPPKSRQKELGPSTLYPCCRVCNCDKGALTLEEYRLYLQLKAKKNGQIK